MKRLAGIAIGIYIALASIFPWGQTLRATDAQTARLLNANVKNIIIMIPDGMGIEGLALARWYKAHDANTGAVDTKTRLVLDELASGLIRTYSFDGKQQSMITDSAAAATAYACGIKTTDRFVGMNYSSTPIATILEATKLMGKATGIVATANIQHATPAAFTSHHADRDRYDIIAEQQVYNGVDVMLGGGSSYLVPPYRKDFENLIDEIKRLGYRYVATADEMGAVASGRLWGMFATKDMAYDIDRGENAATEPSLAEMTTKAIEILSQNEKGFFLMVEGSKVDWAAHAQDPVALVSEILAFDMAVKIALDYAKASQDTMLLIMSDHGTGGLAIGSTLRGSAHSSGEVPKYIALLKKAVLTGEGIITKLDKERSNATETMKAWYGIDDLSDAELEAIKKTPDPDMNDIVGPMISRRAGLGWTTTSHTGGDVVLFSYVPGDGRITGTLENTDITGICADVWGIDLEATTNILYNDAEAYFKSVGAEIALDLTVPSDGRMTVTKGETTLVILENKNFVMLNGTRVSFESVVVAQGGRFFVPQKVLGLIDSLESGRDMLNNPENELIVNMTCTQDFLLDQQMP